MPDAHRTEPDVDIGEADPEQAQPRPKHVTPVQAAHARITLGARGRLGNFIHETADQMPQRMTAESITREQEHVHNQNQRSDADAECSAPVASVNHIAFHAS